jgi:iron complex outermembrane recepter protein
MDTRLQVAVRGVLGAALLMPLVSMAQQQSPAAGSSSIEEVVVTATKRSAALQDVPFSVAAASEDQLRNAGVGNLVDLSRNIAGLTVADLGPGQSQLAIRGISSGQVIRDQPGVKEQVGVYLDETPISVALFTPDLELFDIDRFEVLRGPQGTLFGSGSESGTLRYITKQPKLGVTEAVTDASMSDVIGNGNAIGDTFRGAANLPLGETVAVRMVGYYRHSPGWIEALHPDGTTTPNVNDGTRGGGRFMLLWKPTDNLTIEPRLVFQTLQTNGFPREDAFNILANPYTTAPGFPPVTIGQYQQFTQLPEGLRDDFRLTDVKIDYDMGNMALTSITSYTDRNVLVTRDASQLTDSVTWDVSPNAGQAATVAELHYSSPLLDRTKLSVFSEEARIASNPGGALDWLGGVFYQHVARRYGQDLPTPGYDAFTERLYGTDSVANNAPPDTPFWSDLLYSMRQYAVFGEVNYHVDDRFIVTGGLRYYNFNEDRVLNFGGFFASPTPPGGVPASTNSNGVSPRLILSYKVDEDMQFNAQASRGFRLGGINDPINIPLCSATDIKVFGNQKNWQDETVWNYEVGAKMRFLDRKVTFNLAVFDANIKDLQATTTAGTCSSRIVFNVPTARSAGVEAELFARPNSTWDFGLSATYLDAKLTSSVTSTDASGNVLIVGGLADGNRLPTAPQFQAVGSVGFTAQLDAARSLFTVATLQYVGSSYSQFENEEPNFGLIGGGLPNSARLIPFGGPLTVQQVAFNAQLSSYTLANLRVGEKTDKWEVAAFINNITNELAHTALDYERGRSARVGYLVNQPRTIGLSCRINF